MTKLPGRHAQILWLALGLGLLALTAWPARAEVNPDTLPKLTGRVTDAANILKPDARAAIGAKLKTLEDQSGIQLVVATVPTLQGEEIEPYANALFRAWHLGQKDKNNGALFLIAPNDRKVRFEIGYGLEGTLTDALTKLILRNAVTPKLKTGDYAGGISAGVDEAIAVLSTDKSSWSKRPALRNAAAQADQPVSPLAVVFFFVFFLVVLYMVWHNRRNINWTSAGTGFVVGSMTGGGRGGGYGGGSSGGGDSFSGGGGDSGGGGSSDSY